MIIESLHWQKPNSLGDIFKLVISFFWYFTMWVLTLECFYYLGLVRNIELTLIILHIIVLIGSYYIFNFKEKPFIFKMHNFELELGRKYIVLADLIIHWFTFLILIIVVTKNKKKLLSTFNLGLLIVFPLLYLILLNPIEIYQLEILGYKS